MHKHTSASLLIVPIEILVLVRYNIDRTKESEVNEMHIFPNDYDPDNTDAKELTEYTAQLLDEINERK